MLIVSYKIIYILIKLDESDLLLIIKFQFLLYYKIMIKF